MTTDKAGRAVLVTGCSTGIGRATAERLAARGHTVYASARRVDSIRDLEARGCRLLTLDVTDEDSMREAVAHVVGAEGAVGVLVNNAGYSLSGALETLDMAEVRRQFETNVFGLLRMCQLALPSMRGQRWGRIVNLSSMGANFAFPGGGAYHATKYAVEAISEALRFEVAGFGVGVTVVQPGLIRTRFGERAAEALPGEDGADGPYDRFNAAVARISQDAYRRGLLSRLGGGPDSVARVIERAITADEAPARMRVTPSARVLIAQRRLLSARMWDALMRSQFPQPG